MDFDFMFVMNVSLMHEYIKFIHILVIYMEHFTEAKIMLYW